MNINRFLALCHSAGLCVVGLFSAAVAPHDAWAIGPFGQIDIWTQGSPGGAYASAVDSGDSDNDGDVDVAVGYSNGTVGWFENLNGDGLIWWQNNQPLFTTVTNTFSSSTLFLRDMDADGDLDIVGGNYSGGNFYVAWFANSNDGATWTAQHVAQISGALEWAEPADIDADGDQDIAVAQSNSLGWVELDVGAAAGAHTLATSSMYIRCAHPVNVDADAALEILNVRYYGAYENHQVGIYDIAGGCTVLCASGMSGPWAAWHGDIDGDGDNDVVACTSTEI